MNDEQLSALIHLLLRVVLPALVVLLSASASVSVVLVTACLAVSVTVYLSESVEYS
jgi:hypothetical protein